MPDRSAQRQFPRYQILLPFLHRAIPAALRVGVGWTRNLSEGGACVEVAERLTPGTPHWLRLQTDRGPIDVEARVAWAEESAPNGKGILHGAAFLQIAPGPLQVLRDLIRTKGQERESGVRLPLALSVTCRPEGHPGSGFHGRTADISRGGLSLRLPQALPPGTALTLTLHTPNGPLTAEGTIVWVEPPERRTAREMIAHGLRFTTLGWSTSLSLGLVLAESV